ncbi:hypothetical protein TCAL_10346 [Tigriopus californicus]|uniref:C2H2-type domain-containing protein n=1 Tax=Tigriopus californicus TaxID=6832 RepID=A0A553NEL0_TIGCA|nr:PR domain zinc finger protein 4-like [Tigriopus californicus]TRY63880.1 hypothetical protein TCAL_10346 [Tigriopus californicus]|eukprot:TCALIF_10346-PA protein Name:"Similar to Prdm4 PR domain zinc finger protein 4 (Rattus norvegicus)" AED:0.42 eAED:0.42 QI:0/-1/0/1/-1/1/1/0/696
MDAYKPSCTYTTPNSLQALHEWELSLRLEVLNNAIRPILEKFNRDVRNTLGHLVNVHNETCGCHFNGISEVNRVWNQKKVPFLELQKSSGLSFEDYMSRALRLLMRTRIQDVEPLSEPDFWVIMSQCYAPTETTVVSPDKPTIDDEELNDIQNFILNDIVDETQPNQRFAHDGSQSMNGGNLGPNYLPGDMSEELVKMKRKEKHMAPIDCTGVSVAFGYTWFCKNCNRTHQTKNDCYYYKFIHHPKHVILNSSTHKQGLPPELMIREGSIWTSAPLRAYTRLGPLRGLEYPESKIDFDEDKTNMWLLHCDNGTRKCVITRQEQSSNWLRYVNPADSITEANVLLISMKNSLYLVTNSDLPPNTQLKYFSKEDPTTEFWTSWTQSWANQKVCSRCSIHGQFSSVMDYRTHISLWHDLSFQGNPQNRIYYCPDCNLKSIGAKEIVNHCRDVHNSLPFQCRYCNKRFETYNSLIKHKTRIHSLEKPMKKACEKCGKVYLDPKALKQHVKQVHERSEQLHCNQCEMILSSKYALNRHVKEVHHRQQEHICPKCHKHFTQQSNLKQHMLIHWGVKPFHCRHELCKSAFTTKQCLQVHYRKVHHYTDENMPEIKRQKTFLPNDCLGFRSKRTASSMEEPILSGHETSTDSLSSIASLPTQSVSAKCDHMNGVGVAPSAVGMYSSTPSSSYYHGYGTVKNHML